MIYSFGGFTLDTERYELNLEGESVASEPKVLEVLAYLIGAEGRVVSKEELVEEVWKGRFVSDSAVSRAIREIRRALGDTAAEARWVKTVYGRGFSFQGGAVESVEQSRDRLDRRSEAICTALPTPLTSLIGRDRELAEVLEMLTRTRLLTLSGAGGAGKTRLALEVALRSADRFSGGRLFVALADIAEPALVVSSIARALGIGDAGGSSTLEAVQHHIADRALLLVLDNFEHVVGRRRAGVCRLSPRAAAGR
ncbi:MAG: winged helix-turn-helix domain-containing protein [Acidobacteriota bacterium]